MNTTIRASLVLTLVLAACGHKHDNDDKGEDHHASDHGHGDGDGDGDELPGVAVTEWTDKSELFMEYSPFIVGVESRFLAHVTTLSDFKALLDGEVVVTVAIDGGASETVIAKGPARPGIFIPTYTPTSPGS